MDVTQERDWCVGLKTWLRREGGTWIAWCQAIDVLSQAETEQGAKEALQEAVELWFESCVARGVLAEALLDVGFVRSSSSEITTANAGSISIRRSAPQRGGTKRHSLSITLGDGRGSDCIEACIPAHLLAAPRRSGTCQQAAL